MSDRYIEKDDKQQTLFDRIEPWEDEWHDMPEMHQKDIIPFRSIVVKFSNEEDFKAFEKLIDQKTTSKTTTIWYPKYEQQVRTKRWR